MFKCPEPKKGFQKVIYERRRERFVVLSLYQFMAVINRKPICQSTLLMPMAAVCTSVNLSGGDLKLLSFMVLLLNFTHLQFICGSIETASQDWRGPKELCTTQALKYFICLRARKVALESYEIKNNYIHETIFLYVNDQLCFCEGCEDDTSEKLVTAHQVKNLHSQKGRSKRN